MMPVFAQRHAVAAQKGEDKKSKGVPEKLLLITMIVH